MNANNEIDAMRRIADVLEEFSGDNEAQRRILQWVVARYGAAAGLHAAAPPSTSAAAAIPRPTEDENFEDLADLFDAAGPRTDPDRALVVGHWLTVSEERSDFTSQEVNTELKNLGFGVSNITSAFSSLMRRKPALAMQTAKAGTSQQARKRYKLTRAGRTTVEAMVQDKRESEG